jgi:hypothetical protein
MSIRLRTSPIGLGTLRASRSRSILRLSRLIVECVLDAVIAEPSDYSHD